MDDVGRWISTILGAVAIVTFAALALQRGNRVNLREQLSDSDAENERLERRLNKCEAEHLRYKAEAEAEIAQLKADLAAMQRVVTGEVHLVAISDRLEDLYRLLVQVWERIKGEPKGG